MSSFLPLDAEDVVPHSLKLPRARALISALESAELPYVTVVSALRMKNGAEGVILDAEVELGQEPPVAIERLERLAVLFSPADDPARQCRGARLCGRPCGRASLDGSGYAAIGGHWRRAGLRRQPLCFLFG